MKKANGNLKQAVSSSSVSTSVSTPGSASKSSPAPLLPGAQGALARVRRELRMRGYPIGSDPLDYAEQPGGGIIFIAPDGRKFRL